MHEEADEECITLLLEEEREYVAEGYDGPPVQEEQQPRGAIVITIQQGCLIEGEDHECAEDGWDDMLAHVHKEVAQPVSVD